MPESIYDIDHRKLVRWYTPKPLRKTKWLTWLGVWITPIVQLYNSFLLYRKAKLYDLMITEQVCYLEMMLNDRWDFTSRRIYIDDAVEYPPLYLYQDDELQPIDLYTDPELQPQYLYTDGEGGQFADDFVIFIPFGIVFSELELRSLVNKKKLPGMRYKIQII